MLDYIEEVKNDAQMNPSMKSNVIANIQRELSERENVIRQLQAGAPVSPSVVERFGLQNELNLQPISRPGEAAGSFSYRLAGITPQGVFPGGEQASRTFTGELPQGFTPYGTRTLPTQELPVSIGPFRPGNVTPPTQIPGITLGQTGTTTPGQTGTTTGNADLDAILNQMQSLLQDTITAGYQINPNVTIGPEQIAEFTSIAEKEIDPYYTTQLKLARESFLREVGYTTEDIGTLEAQLQRKYAGQLRQVGEEFAERGLAYSGQRKLAEEELATETGEVLSGVQREAQRGAQRAASTFAAQYGMGALPQTPQIPSTRVIPGEEKFRTLEPSALYTLSPSVYDGLVGEQEFQRRAAVAQRKAELTGLTRELGGIEAVRKIL